MPARILNHKLINTFKTVLEHVDIPTLNFEICTNTHCIFDRTKPKIFFTKRKLKSHFHSCLIKNYRAWHCIKVSQLCPTFLAAFAELSVTKKPKRNFTSSSLGNFTLTMIFVNYQKFYFKYFMRILESRKKNAKNKMKNNNSKMHSKTYADIRKTVKLLFSSKNIFQQSKNYNLCEIMNICDRVRSGLCLKRSQYFC